MKKILLLIGLVAGVSLGVNAQHFITSFGYSLNWDMPYSVQHTITHDYYGYDVVHATQAISHGVSYFDIILQNRNAYIKITVRNDGFISRREIYNHNPLYNHVCNSHCGYHTNYYTAYYDNCNSHNHYGHNHVTYVKNYVPKHGHGYAHGYYEKKNKNNSSYKKSPVRTVAKRDTYTRRDRYYDQPKEIDNRSNKPSRTRYTGNSGSVRSRTGN